MAKKEQKTHPLAILREKEGLTQAELAGILGKDKDGGYSEKYISLIETGNRNLSLKLAKQLSELFGYKIEWLLGESPFPTNADYINHEFGKADYIDSKIKETIGAVLYDIGFHIHEHQGLSPDKKQFIHYAKITNDKKDQIVIDGEQLDEITDSIQDYIEFLFRQLFIRKEKQDRLNRLVSSEKEDAHNEV